MRRLLPTVVAVAVLGGCSTGSSPAVLPSGTTVVATLAYPGGFTSMSYAALETPALVVYSDGTVVADAATTLTLPTTEVATLVGDLRRDLDGYAGTVPTPEGEHVTDVGTTTITILLADGREQTVAAYGLGFLDGFDDRLKTAWGRLNDLRQRSIETATPFRSDRIRIAVEAGPQPGDGARPWPPLLPLPKVLSPGGVAALDLSDPAEVLAASAALDDGERGHRFRTIEGTVLWVEWRYLLNHEPTRR